VEIVENVDAAPTAASPVSCDHSCIYYHSWFQFSSTWPRPDTTYSSRKGLENDRKY